MSFFRRRIRPSQDDWEAANRELAARRPPVIAWHPPTGLLAQFHGPDDWRFLEVAIGDERLTAGEIADLVLYVPDEVQLLRDRAALGDGRRRP